MQDPVSITLVWVLYELARNPDIVAALHAEISSTSVYEDPRTVIKFSE